MYQGPRKPADSNLGSKLLSDYENSSIFETIGKRCTSLSTSPVQLFCCMPNQQYWEKKLVGVACFIKDNLLKSYFIRIIDIHKHAVVWEQELYNQFQYTSPRPYFHTFEADSYVVGMNFSSSQEAEHFKRIIDEKLFAKQQRKNERRATQVRKAAPTANVLQPVKTNQQITPSVSSNDLNKKKNLTIGKGGKKKAKLTKGDIGTPSDFRHVGHIGWDPKEGYDVNNIDPQWKNLFDRIGVTEKELQDKETSQFIYDFVESHGGIEKATKELDKSATPKSPPPPPPPSRGVPPRSAAPPPPPPGHKGPPARSAPPPPPGSKGPSRGGRIGPPPPPPQTSAPPPPPPSSRNVPPPPPPLGAPAPPPPPPPPPGPGAPPPPPAPAGPPSLPVSGGRGGLLDEIHKGKQLQKVDVNEQEDSSEGGGRNDLLNAIRKGAQLKSVSSDDRQSTGGPELEGMAGALAKALAARSTHIQVSDDDNDDDDEEFDDEDEWSD